MTDAIFPHQLPEALAHAPESIRLLSLDCFDTLIWRNVYAPAHVFADFGEGGATPQQRIWAEGHARSSAKLRRNRNETTIAEIYTALLPDSGDEDREQAIAAELRAEASHCFGFGPTVALMRAAKAADLPIAIVSDTYLDQSQLRSLIVEAAGEEVAGLIDHICCSSEYGVSKAEGLFEHVLRVLRLRPEQILHIGDNKVADFTAPQALGIPAIHLRQFPEADQQRFRLEAAADAIVNGAGAAAMPAFQPHRAAIAAAGQTFANAAEALGHATLGPVLHAFGRWVEREAAALSSGSGRTHLLFLMRDGHLPQRVFDTLATGLNTHAIEISRFTAIAGSFTDEAAVTEFLEIELQGDDFEGIAKQLLFTPDEIAALIRKLPAGGRAAAFAAAVRAPANLRKIVARSQAFAERLVHYIRATVDPHPGDTLMLVDLGYNGTVQDKVEPLLRRAFVVEVAGRYLLLREQKLSRRDKRGMIDGRNYAATTLEGLCASVAVLEQLCTAAQGSVIGYDDEGRPVRAGSSVKARQSNIRDQVQRGCVRFAAEREAAFVRAPLSDGPETRRQSAAAVLARLLFLPLPHELDVLASFEHDVNLGSAGTVRLFDADLASRGLKRRGLFYMKGSERMYLPAELRGQGLPSSLALLTQHRFGLDLKYADFCDRAITLPIIVADGNNIITDQVDAHPTHDGWFMAAIPIGVCRFAIGVQFGQLYDWVQVDSAQFVPVRTFLTDKEARNGEPIEALPSLEGMEQVAPHLMRCDDKAAFLMIPPPALASPEPMMLTVVFRPIAERQPAEKISPAVRSGAGAVR